MQNKLAHIGKDGLSFSIGGGCLTMPEGVYTTRLDCSMVATSKDSCHPFLCDASAIIVCCL